METDGEYPSVIACNITNGAMPHGSNSIYKEEFPNVNHLKDERFIAEIEHGTLLGYKYFHFVGQQRLQVEIRLEKGNTCLYEGPLRLDERCFDRGEKKTGYCENPPSDECYFEVRHAIEAKEVGRIYLNPSQTWNIFEGNINFLEGDYPLYFIYHGKVKIQFKSFKFIANKN